MPLHGAGIDEYAGNGDAGVIGAGSVSVAQPEHLACSGVPAEMRAAAPGEGGTEERTSSFKRTCLQKNETTALIGKVTTQTGMNQIILSQ